MKWSIDNIRALPRADAAAEGEFQRREQLATKVSSILADKTNGANLRQKAVSLLFRTGTRFFINFYLKGSALAADPKK